MVRHLDLLVCTGCSLEFGCLIEKNIIRFHAQQGLWFAGRHGGRMGGTSHLVVLVR